MSTRLVVLCSHLRSGPIVQIGQQRPAQVTGDGPSPETIRPSTGAVPDTESGTSAGVILVAQLEKERAAWRAKLCDEARLLQQDPLFQYDPVIDQEQFRRDGVVVLPGVYTETATERLTRACQSIQRLNDLWVNKDWLDPLTVAGWAAAGLRPPSALASPELRQRLTGGTQLGARDSSSSPGLFDGSDFKGLQEDKRAPYLQGFCPEAFACGYDAMLLNAYTHPQMLALQRQMLGADLRFDHWYASLTPLDRPPVAAVHDELRLLFPLSSVVHTDQRLGRLPVQFGVQSESRLHWRRLAHARVLGGRSRPYNQNSTAWGGPQPYISARIPNGR